MSELENSLRLRTLSVFPIQQTGKNKTVVPHTETQTASFDALFLEEKRKVSFSEHAKARIQARRIDLSEKDLYRLGETVDKMAAKGAKESLILLNEVALIVSVKNRTVITAMDGESAKESIFTNIDSAAIL